MRISIVGSGYVGTTIAACFAEDDATRTDRSGPFFTDSTAVFRTMYADQTGESDDTATAGWEYNQWNTRSVTDEFEADGWKELSLEQQSFVHLDDTLLETYGDASVVGVGISRGDPYYGPSVLDSYYRNLYLNGEQYSSRPASNSVPPIGGTDGCSSFEKAVLSQLPT